jgi:hypothetical protein
MERMAGLKFLIDELKVVRSSKESRIAMLRAGDLSCILYGIDVSDGTLAQEREELALIEAVLEMLDIAGEA